MENPGFKQFSHGTRTLVDVGERVMGEGQDEGWGVVLKYDDGTETELPLGAKTEEAAEQAAWALWYMYRATS